MSKRIKELHPDFVRIAICGKLVFPWEGLWYPKLAPKRWFFDEWEKDHDNAKYVGRFNDEVLRRLSRRAVRDELARLSGGFDRTIVLMCYEKPGDFCHRHLVAGWLGDVEELQLDPIQDTLGI